MSQEDFVYRQSYHLLNLMSRNWNHAFAMKCKECVQYNFQCNFLKISRLHIFKIKNIQYIHFMQMNLLYIFDKNIM